MNASLAAIAFFYEISSGENCGSIDDGTTTFINPPVAIVIIRVVTNFSSARVGSRIVVITICVADNVSCWYKRMPG